MSAHSREAEPDDRWWGGWEQGCGGRVPGDMPRHRNEPPRALPEAVSASPGPVGVFVWACAHVACFVVVVAVLVVFVVVWANDNRGLAGWLLLSTLGSFQAPRQEILPTIAAVNWPIFLERG